MYMAPSGSSCVYAMVDIDLSQSTCNIQPWHLRRIATLRRLQAQSAQTCSKNKRKIGICRAYVVYHARLEIIAQPSRSVTSLLRIFRRHGSSLTAPTPNCSAPALSSVRFCAGGGKSSAGGFEMVWVALSTVGGFERVPLGPLEFWDRSQLGPRSAFLGRTTLSAINRDLSLTGTSPSLIVRIGRL